MFLDIGNLYPLHQTQFFVLSAYRISSNGARINRKARIIAIFHLRLSSSGLVCGGQAMKLFPRNNSLKKSWSSREITSPIIYITANLLSGSRILKTEVLSLQAQLYDSKRRKHIEAFDPMSDVKKKEKISIRKQFGLFGSLHSVCTCH